MFFSLLAFVAVAADQQPVHPQDEPPVRRFPPGTRDAESWRIVYPVVYPPKPVPKKDAGAIVTTQKCYNVVFYYQRAQPSNVLEVPCTGAKLKGVQSLPKAHEECSYVMERYVVSDTNYGDPLIITASCRQKTE